jgi:hypothetical protein
MAVPLATTTIAVRRVQGGPYDIDTALPAPATVAAKVRAHISTPTGRGTDVGGQEELVEFRLACDPVELRHTDTVLDEQTSESYQVVWAKQRRGLGLAHTEAGLRQTAGAAP